MAVDPDKKLKQTLPTRSSSIPIIN